MENLIRPLDFCEIVSDKFAEEAGVKRGHIIYVAGLKALPVSNEDPYTQRIKFFVNLVNMDGSVDPRLFMIDPNSIQKVKPSRQKTLKTRVKKYHDKLVADANSTN